LSATLPDSLSDSRRRLNTDSIIDPSTGTHVGKRIFLRKVA
jgi:hypothetical protein